MKKYANKGQRPLELQVGDKVMLKFTPQIWEKKRTIKRWHKVLIQLYDRPFEIAKCVATVAYRFVLLRRWRFILPSVSISLSHIMAVMIQNAPNQSVLP